MGKISRVSTPAPLADAHEVSRFDCGNAVLNDWLRTKAPKSEGRSARCYVVCEGNTVVGYYALTTGAVRHDKSAPRALRANLPDPTPVIVLGRLAVDEAYRGRGIGGGLLKDALSRALAASRIVGARAVIVHAIDDEAARFYAAFGFKPFPGEARTMYLATEAIQNGL
jgi:predicted N-acetyltransferase YhbS